jgi:P2-related tail formation protein
MDNGELSPKNAVSRSALRRVVEPLARSARTDWYLQHRIGQTAHTTIRPCTAAKESLTCSFNFLVGKFANPFRSANAKC